MGAGLGVALVSADESELARVLLIVVFERSGFCLMV